MKISQILLAATTLLASATAIAGPGGSPLTGSFLASEKLQEKLLCPSGVCGKQSYGSFQVKYTAAPYTSDTIGRIDSTSVLDIEFKNLKISQAIGSDPKFQDGDTRASMMTIVSGPFGSVVAVRTKLSWKGGKLRIQVKGITPFVDSPLAADSIGSTPGDISPSAQLIFTITTGFQGFGFTTPSLPFPGKLSRTTKNVNGVDYQLDKIKIAGGQFF